MIKWRGTLRRLTSLILPHGRSIDHIAAIMHMPRSTVLAQMINARRTPATPPITIGMAAAPRGGKICLVPPIFIPKSRSTEGVDGDVQRPI
jgi:hypothetical protein